MNLNCPKSSLLSIVPDAEMPLAGFSPFAHPCPPCWLGVADLQQLCWAVEYWVCGTRTITAGWACAASSTVCVLWAHLHTGHQLCKEMRGLGWLCWKTETQCMPLPSSSWGGGAPSSLQPVPSSQLSHITGLCLDLLILWRRLTCGLEVRRVACLWLAKACVLKDALAPNDFLSVGLASRTDAQP